MKAIIVFKPDDFGLLEAFWNDHLLFLPVLGQPLISHYVTFLSRLSVSEIRLLVASSSFQESVILEKRLKQKWPGIHWSVRHWNKESFFAGPRLLQMLYRQKFFLNGQQALVIKSPVLFVSPFLEAKVSCSLFKNTSSLVAPKIITRQGCLEPIDLGAYASLGSPLDFFQTQMILMKMMLPQTTSLKGVHVNAELTPPVFFPQGIKIAAQAKIGPQCLLASGTKIEAQTKLEKVVILSPVRVGKGFEFQDQIVHGNRLLCPYRNKITEISTSRLLCSLKVHRYKQQAKIWD